MSDMEFRTLPRIAVTDALTKALRTYPLVVLTAPMGYGKTTAARSVVRNEGLRSFYLTIAPGTHNAFYLWNRVCGQMSLQGSEFATTMHANGFPTDPGATQRIIDYGRIGIAGRPTLMVLDDYHNVSSPDVDKFLEAVVREEIAELRLLLVSRTRPNLPLDDLCLKGLAAVFDKELLAFSQEDAALFFSMNGITGKETISKAWQYSEGWAAALWLSMQSYKAHGGLAPERSVESLLESAVFSLYDDDDKRLLLTLSLLAEFSPRQATALTGDPSTPRKLLALHEKNAFLNYDPLTDTYTLHSIFHSFLFRMLAERGHPLTTGFDLAELNRRIAHWYATEGDMLQAIKAYAAAGSVDDFLAILRIFETPNDGQVVMFDPAAVKAICTGIPWSVRMQCPIGYLAFVYHYLSRVNLTEALPLLAEAEERFAVEPSLPAELKRRIQGEIILIRGVQFFNDLYAMRDIHEEAHSLLGGQSAIAHRHLIWTFGTPHIMFSYLRTAGEYQRLLDLIRGNLHFFQDMANGCSAGAQDLFVAEYNLERGRLKQVESYLMKAIYRASSKEQASTYIAAKFTEARYLLALGQGGKAVTLLEGLDALLYSSCGALLVKSLDASKGYIHACLGNYEGIPKWLQEGHISDFYQSAAFSRVTHGKCLLLKKNWILLETFAQDLPGLLGGRTYLFANLHALLMEAVAAYHLYGHEESLVLLRKALDLARPDHIVLTLAEYGRYLLPLLRQLSEQESKTPFVRDVLRLSKRYAQQPRFEEQGIPPDCPLKDRERMLLHLAAEGKSNSAIAEHLGISEAAVKKSFSTLYRKLNLSGRVAAVQYYHSVTKNTDAGA